MARPNLSYLKNLTLAIVGLGAGAWSGLSGMGAAPLIAPTLAWLIGLRERRLSAVALLVTTVAALAALLAYGQAHFIHLADAIIFSVFSIVGSLIGALPALAGIRFNRGALLIWALVTIALGCWLIYFSKHGLIAAASPFSVGSIEYHAPLPLLAIAGFIAGLFAAAADLGGVLAVPALLLICGESPLVAQATSLTVVMLVSILPLTAYIARRDAPEQPAFWCCFGAALGALFGSRYALNLHPATLVTIYGAGLCAIGAMRLSFSQRRPITPVEEE